MITGQLTFHQFTDRFEAILIDISHALTTHFPEVGSQNSAIKSALFLRDMVSTSQHSGGLFRFILNLPLRYLDFMEALKHVFQTMYAINMISVVRCGVNLVDQQATVCYNFVR